MKKSARRNGARATRTIALSLTLLTALATVPAFGAIPQIERDALIVLYNSTNGPGWKYTDNWNGVAGTECSCA